MNVWDMYVKKSGIERYMLQLLDSEVQAELRRDYLSDKLFGTLFPGLAELERMYNELSPTQVWREAKAITDSLSGQDNIGLEVIQTYNDLLKKYTVFQSPDGNTVRRSENQALYTTVCVLTCVNFRLVARPDNLSTEDCDDAIREILGLIGRHAVHAHLYKAQRRREEILDNKNQMIQRVDCLDSGRSRKEPARLQKMTDSEMSLTFTKLFRSVCFAEWVGFVKYCETNMTFVSKIDRVAYLMFAAQKSWLKSPKTINVQGWTKFMNSIIGSNLQMTQSEVLRKYNAMKSEPFFDSQTKMSETIGFNAINLPQKSFETLKENVKLMHAQYRQYKELNNENPNGEQ